jgi:hypothetical protein
MSIDVIKMGRWLGIGEQISRAKTEALNLATRWDVPQGQRKPGQDKADKEIYIEAKKGVWRVLAHDLRDIRGRFYRTTPDPVTGQQGRVAGHMLQEDLVLGAFSVSIPLLFGLLSIFGVLNILVGGSALVLPLSLIMLMLTVLIVSATEKVTWGVIAVFLAAGLPWLGTLMSGSGNPLGMFGGGATLPLVLGGSCIAAGVLYGGLKGARMVVGAFFGVVLVIFAASHTPALIRPLVLSLPGALLPAFWAISEEMRRAKRLALQGRLSFEASSLPLSHIEGRLEQSRRASLDESPLITYGTALGNLSGRGDAWSPDAGLPMVQSTHDIATHLLVLGSTGRGKTSAIIRPVVVAWINSKQGGILIMDGKASLALEFAGLRNYLLIDPSIPGCIVGLYEGMTPSDVSRTLSQIFMTDDSQSKDRMWNDLAYDMSRHSAVVLRALVDMQDLEETPADKRQWKWSLHNHLHVAVMGLAGADAIADEPAVFEDIAQAENAQRYARSGKQTLQTFLDYLKANHPKADVGLLAEARHYFLSQLPAQPATVRGSIFTTFSSWLTIVLGDEALLTWGQAETGVRVEDCLHGRPVGINLPETRYGRSGAVATAFLKNRVFNEVRRRADGDWRKSDPTAKPVLCVMDECQVLLTEAEMEITSMSRQLGAYFVCCTQTIESIRQTSQNQNKIEAFLDSFQSFIVLSSSHATIEWVSQRIGTTWQRGSSDGSMGIDFGKGAILSLESPLFEQSHPLRRWMQKLLRQGAGGFNDMAKMPQNNNEDLAFNLCVTSAWEEKSLLYRADFSTLTHQQGIALVQLTRAGSPRRDFIRLDRVMNEMPEELMDPDFLARRSLQKADEIAEQERRTKEEEPVAA